MSQGGYRDNGGKIRWDLVPMDAMEELARVYSYGATKYGDRNWEKGLSWMDCYASLMRHLVDWHQGQDFDGTPGEADNKHSGMLTMAHVAWNAMAILAFQIRGEGVDDRPALNRLGVAGSDLSDEEFGDLGSTADLFDDMLAILEREDDDAPSNEDDPDADPGIDRGLDNRPDVGSDIARKPEEVGGVAKPKDPNESKEPNE